MRWRLYLLFLLAPVAAVAPGDSGAASQCASCHSQAKSQPSTSMAHALESVAECKVLIEHPILSTSVGKYSYRIERMGKQSMYSVSDGTRQLTIPIKWAMGASSAIGQTYILEKNGDLYESRVSYFSELNGLGPTLGSVGSMPRDLDEAAGRRMGVDDKLRCFGCHATNAVSGRNLTFDKLQPGVQCERCHESTQSHLGSMILEGFDSNPPQNTRIVSKSAEQVSNFCGQCHRTWEEIALQGQLDISNIRFQPYRLTGSKCYDADDPRISCLACHEPHHEVIVKSTDYDAKCQACHGGGKLGARTCFVSNNDCASCHMPKLELPGAHHKFADHRIRIVRPNEKYPG
jgi:hypothetical protein